MSGARSRRRWAPPPRYVYTEQGGAYLDGHGDPRQREHGTGQILEALGRQLTS